MTEILKHDHEGLSRAAMLMFQGEVIVTPTDTIYGLSCDASNIAAINKVYALKERSHDKVMPIFVSSLEEAMKIAYFPEGAVMLAKKFWPGPLTLVLKGRTEALLGNTQRGIGHLCMEDGTLAIRVSSSDTITALLKLLKRPMITTSANKSGQDPLSDPTKIAVVFGPALAAVLRDHKTSATELLGAQASTIVRCLEGKEIEVLRQGAVNING
ncbi:MAG: threonylcarbamoyl-AMP synthase [Proteobacteria bacterium]|nr:threonylcarbamoyl-AMP synthase [Pseudomonadota bacterium]